MDAIEFRNKIIRKCIEILESKIESTRVLIKEIEQSAAEYGPPKDRYDSFRNQLSRRRELLAEQIMRAETEIDIIKRIDIKRQELIVSLGAIVITTKQKLFVSVGLGKFEFDLDIYYAVSPDAPLIQAMKGLKKGDTFEFRGEQIRIIEIF
jgi:hypothetical protein